MKKIGVVSLGCDKNRVDTENMLAFLTEDGYTITGDPSDADIIIVNTCAFIQSAKVEAINTVLEMAEYKNSGKCRCLVVTGCLPQRYMDELQNEFEEVDILLGTASYDKLPAMLAEFTGSRTSLANDKDDRHFVSKRILTTPYHYAYLKIAEGCDNKCTYCAIPNIRGKYTSRPIEHIVVEAKSLIVDYGVKELIIVAQDITKYGIDIYNEYRLIELLKQLEQLDIRWIRLLYAYPELVTDELLKHIAASDKIVKYIDIPMQHASDDVLKRMNRRISRAKLSELVARIRDIDSEIAIRTTFIVGFPGESEEQYRELYEFVERMQFDKCGFFAYSPEDGTAAIRLPDQIDEQTKQRRVAELYELQRSIAERKAEAKVGCTLKAIYEDIDYENSTFVMRLATDAPEIDSFVHAESDFPLDIGEIYNVKITAADGMDYVGTVVSNDCKDKADTIQHDIGR